MDRRGPPEVRFVGSEAVVAGYADPVLGPESGLELGDEIVRIGDDPVASLVAAWRPLFPASNEPARLRRMARYVTQGQAGPVDLAVRRAGAELQLSAWRTRITELPLSPEDTHDLPGPAFQMLSEDVAYLKLSGVVASETADYVRQAEGTRVLVIDIRNYPQQFVPFALGQHLVSEPTPFAKFTTGDVANPGGFVWTAPVVIQPAEPHYDGKVVILVDESSISQSEYTAMAMRTAPNALVVGSTTAGADGNVSTIPLPGGLTTIISGIGVFYPDGTPTQQVGIVPDLVVTPTIEGIGEGRDEVLEAGVSLALGETFRLEVRP